MKVSNLICSAGMFMIAPCSAEYVPSCPDSDSDIEAMVRGAFEDACQEHEEADLFVLDCHAVVPNYAKYTILYTSTKASDGTRTPFSLELTETGDSNSYTTEQWVGFSGTEGCLADSLIPEGLEFLQYKREHPDGRLPPPY